MKISLTGKLEKGATDSALGETMSYLQTGETNVYTGTNLVDLRATSILQPNVKSLT